MTIPERRRKKDGYDDLKSFLLSRVRVSDGGCWNWIRAVNGHGRNAYGVQWINGKKFKTHRLFFAIFHGVIPDGKMVLHSCDNPRCCNPEHLFIGTAKENRDDAISKGRMRYESGTDRYNAKLNDEKVREIRTLYRPRKVGIDQLAARFGVSRSMIFAIVKRQRWKQVMP